MDINPLNETSKPPKGGFFMPKFQARSRLAR